MRKPTHPGEILRLDILPNTRIPITMIARLLRISRQQLHRILMGESPVTPMTAVRLGALFKNDAQFWLNLQAKYDIWQARQKLGRDLEVLESLSPANGRAAAVAALEQMVEVEAK
ncbi:MAG: HigA family addiction module antidote protein [Gammaproteobacteria bacterium]|nr:HigA family addiction module antidote protein [Gammaproteobacteria bacterium]